MEWFFRRCQFTGQSEQVSKIRREQWPHDLPSHYRIEGHPPPFNGLEQIAVANRVVCDHGTRRNN